MRDGHTLRLEARAQGGSVPTVNKGRLNAHHDALEFPDGKTVLLTQLCKGQHATVLQLPVTSAETVSEGQRYGSPVA